MNVKGIEQVSRSTSAEAADSGNANPDFRYDPALGTGGGYIFNLATTGLSMGSYVLRFTAGSDPHGYEVAFQVR